MSADGRGRSRTRRLGLRLTEAEWERWARAAREDGRTIGGWVRWRVGQELKRQEATRVLEVCEQPMVKGRG